MKNKDESIDHRVIGGALFDFLGALTTGRSLMIGSAHDAALALERLREFAEVRGIDLDQADVTGWNADGEV